MRDGEERKVIGVVDRGEERYCVEANFGVLGRMWDDGAEEVVVEKPEGERESLCVMIVTANGAVVDHLVVGDEPVKIRSNLSQYESVKIGFSFTRADGSVKNSGVEKFYFLVAQKPDGFVPVEPEQRVLIEQLARVGFAGVELQNNELVFYGVGDNEVKRLQLSGFVQEQSDMGETDEQSETFVRGKKTSNLENDGDGESPFATIKQLNEIKEASKKIDGATSKISIDNTGDEFSISGKIISDGVEKDTKTSFSGSNISMIDNKTNQAIRPTINESESMAYLSDIDNAIRAAISESWQSNY